MFTIDINQKNYRPDLINVTNQLFQEHGFNKPIEKILPKVSVSGESGGCLTKEGAKLLDASNKLESGCIMCGPEGDAGSGMVATNSVVTYTGNVSAGRSAFSVVVLS